MIYNPDDVNIWPGFKPLIIAHDVGRSHDRSTAVVGGNSPYGRRVLGIREARRAAAEPVWTVHGPARSRRSIRATVAMRSLSQISANDATYAEVLHETFGPRVIGLHITGAW